MDFDIAITFFN